MTFTQQTRMCSYNSPTSPSALSSLARSAHTITHIITQLINHSLTYAITQILNHSLTHSFTESITQLLTHLSHSLDHSLTRCDSTNRLQAIESEKVTIFKTGSALVRQLVSSQSAPKLKKMNLSSLKWGTFCAEPVSLDAQEFAVRHLCKNFMNSYVTHRPLIV